MAYSAQWVNRVERANSVDIDLNLTDGARFRRRAFNFERPAAQVNQAFLDQVAAVVITEATSRDTSDAQIAAFVAANSDLAMFATNNADILTLISRNSLPYSAAQVRAFFAAKLFQANVELLNDIAQIRFG